TLMTTTMEKMAEVVNILKSEEIRDSYKVIIGGGPISQSFADRIGADGYSVNAAEAVRLVKRLVGGAA
ncbi:MAG TPA: cobalamin-binding protein, partial [Clostridia bacterium]